MYGMNDPVFATPPAKPGPTLVATDLLNSAVAAAIADAIWTWDGQSYDRWWIEAYCARTCELVIQGIPASDIAGEEDMYHFHQFDPSRPAQTLELGDYPSLGGYPAALDPEIEQLGRALDEGGVLDDLGYFHASWFPPPRSGEFLAFFSDGNEEGGSNAYVWLNLVERRLIKLLPVTCCG
jgi:hypothetical protein